MDENASVLVVEDERDVAETFRAALDSDYAVYVALSGREAIDVLESKDVDVVLLDRWMPGLSGDDVLEWIEDREIDCQVAMVTAVDPDFDILTMGFDEYLLKPVSEEDLRRTVENLLDRTDLSEKRREYAALRAKQTALEAEKNDHELANNDQYDQLRSRIETLERALDDADQSLADNTTFVSMIEDIDEGGE